MPGMDATSNTSRVSRGRSTLAVMKTQQAVAHPASDVPPVCSSCAGKGVDYVNPGCTGCWDIIAGPSTSVAQLFAILRQWTPLAQAHIEDIAKQILCRGGHLDDRDGMTGMTLLHYAARAGAEGYGDARRAARLAASLVLLGASADLASEWTGMTPLHVAAHYGCDAVVGTLLEGRTPANIEATVPGLDGATPLHLAAVGRHVKVVDVLLAHNANPFQRDAMGRTPRELIASADDEDPALPSPPNAAPVAQVRAALEAAEAKVRETHPEWAEPPTGAGDAGADTQPAPRSDDGGRSTEQPAPRTQPVPSTMSHVASANDSSRRRELEDAGTHKRAMGGKSLSVRFDTAVEVHTLSRGFKGDADADNDDAEDVAPLREDGAPAENEGAARAGHAPAAQRVALSGTVAPLRAGRTEGSSFARAASVTEARYLAGRTTHAPTDSPRRLPHSQSFAHGDGSGAAHPPGTLGAALSDPMITAMLSPRLLARLAETKAHASTAEGPSHANDESSRTHGTVPNHHAHAQQAANADHPTQAHAAPAHSASAHSASAHSATSLPGHAHVPHQAYAPLPTATSAALQRAARLREEHELGSGSGSAQGGSRTGSRAGSGQNTPNGVRASQAHHAANVAAAAASIEALVSGEQRAPLSTQSVAVTTAQSHLQAATASADKHSTPGAHAPAAATPSSEKHGAVSAAASASEGHHLETPTHPLQRGSGSNHNIHAASATPSSPRPQREQAQRHDLREGQNVSVNGEVGVIKYIGLTDFAKGVWVGVVLKKPVGKNNGSVHGRQYFACKPNHGVFVKYSDKIVPITENK